MTGLSRRTAMRGALSLALGLKAAPVLASPGVLLPPGPMTLSRLIERGLAGGAKIVVERSWTVEFTRQGTGIAISGRQTHAKVEAPESLKRLAEVEQARSTDGMFPLLLSETGTLMAAGDFIAKPDLALAIREAEAIIAKRPLPTNAKAELRSYVAEIQRVGAKVLDIMPVDLFFPSTPRIHTIEPVSLPDGIEGEFELIYEAQAIEGGGWLKHAERTVITRIASDERRSREVWTLS